MADSPASPATIDPNFKQPESNNPNRKPDTPSTSTSQPEQQQQQHPSIINPNPSPNPNQTPAPASLPPALVQSFAPPTQPISYRPVPMSTASQFSPVQNYQSPVVQPPGVGGVAVTMAPPMMQYPGVPGQPPNPALRPYAPIPNGYGAVPAPASGGSSLYYI